MFSIPFFRQLKDISSEEQWNIGITHWLLKIVDSRISIIFYYNKLH